MKTRKFCRNNSQLQLLWELRERQLEGILGPVKRNPRETDIKANIMNPTASTNLDNTDTYNATQEDTTTSTTKFNSSNNAATKVDKPELTCLTQAVDARRSFELDKIRRHKMEAAEDIERYKKEKLQRLQAKEEEKKRDLQMLTDYYPWGRSLGNFERKNYATQPQEYATPTQNFASQSVRWPLDLRDLDTDEGIHTEILKPQKDKDKLELSDPNEHLETDIQLSSDPRLENTQNTEQEEKIADITSSGNKRKYTTPDPNSKFVGMSPRVKRSPSPSEVMRARAARVYMEELKKGMEEQRKKKEEMERQVRAPIGELVTVMGKGKVGRPRRDPLTGLLLDNHLKTSDVSKEKIGKLVEENPTEKAKYGYDLIHAAEERYRMKELEKLKAKQQEIQHQETYNEIWGRPGGGAPRDAKLGNRMAKLNNMLYKDRLGLDINNLSSAEYQEQRISPSVRYSTHQNYYDYPNNVKDFKEYNFRTPWASYY